VNPHFQITQRQLKGYTESLKSRGFRQETLESDKRGQDLPSGLFYAIIQRDNNYFYDEITVVNCIADFKEIEMLSATIPLREIATRMFTTDYDEVCENMMCEEVRHKYSGVCNVKDIYFDGDSLFELEGNDVWKVTVRGNRRKQNFKKTEFNTSYRPEIQWWDWSLHFGRGSSHPWDSIIFVHKTTTTQLNKGSKRTKRS